jgi:hypothetical protein
MMDVVETRNYPRIILVKEKMLNGANKIFEEWRRAVSESG